VEESTSPWPSSSAAESRFQAEEKPPPNTQVRGRLHFVVVRKAAPFNSESAPDDTSPGIVNGPLRLQRKDPEEQKKPGVQAPGSLITRLICYARINFI
jgi:hypothetical protein